MKFRDTSPSTDKRDQPRWKSAAALTAIGALPFTLSACGDKIATAESAMTVTSEATVTVTADESVSPTTEAPAETTTAQPTSPEATDDVSEVEIAERIKDTPEYQAYVNSISPESLAKLTTEQEIREAFRITLEKLPETDASGQAISVPEAHGAFFIESRHALQNAGSTPAEIEPFVDENAMKDKEGYETYVIQKYALPAIDELTLEASTYNPDEDLHTEYYHGQLTIGHYYRTGEANQPYRTEVTADNIAVIDNGNGVTDTYSVELGWTTKEVYDEEAALMLAGVTTPPLSVTETVSLMNVTQDPETGALKPLITQNYSQTINN